MQIQITDGVPLRLAVRCRRRRRRRCHTRHLLERVSGGVTDTFDLNVLFLYFHPHHPISTLGARNEGIYANIFYQ